MTVRGVTWDYLSRVVRYGPRTIERTNYRDRIGQADFVQRARGLALWDTHPCSRSLRRKS